LRSARDVVHFTSPLDVRALASQWADDHGYRAHRFGAAALVFFKRPMLRSLPIMVELASRGTDHTLSCWGRRGRLMLTRDISLTDPARAGRATRQQAQHEINGLLWLLGAPPLGGPKA
jgi:hypothetical protein